MLKPYYQAEGVTLYHGDCKEILPQLRLEKSYVAIVSDPPWGINANVDYTRFTNSTTNWNTVGCLRNNYGDGIVQDDKPFDPSDWMVYPYIALWGGHCFSNKLPLGRWLIWLKKKEGNFGNFLSDAELCWVKRKLSGPPGCYCFHHVWDGFDRASEKGKVVHPTQKPVELIKWTISMCDIPSNYIILDPYCGSGSTLEAAMRLGYTTIGCEIEERYCEVAARRLIAVPEEMAKEREKSEVTTRSRNGLRNRGNK